MGLDFYCKFKQNQETTKIAFVSFQILKLFQQKVHPNNFYPKIFTWMQNYLPFGHKPIKTDAKETYFLLAPEKRQKENKR